MLQFQFPATGPVAFEPAKYFGQIQGFIPEFYTERKADAMYSNCRNAAHAPSVFVGIKLWELSQSGKDPTSHL